MSVWRVGRKVGRTVYQQGADEAADGDALIGLMDTPGLARLAAAAPELLEALERVLPMAQSWVEREGKGQEVIRQAETAIVKAVAGQGASRHLTGGA